MILDGLAVMRRRTECTNCIDCCGARFHVFDRVWPRLFAFDCTCSRSAVLACATPVPAVRREAGASTVIYEFVRKI